MPDVWGAGVRPPGHDESVSFEEPHPLMREPSIGDDFPVEALGKVLAPAARAIQDRVQAPMAIGAQSLLATTALATQGHADIELPFGETKPLSLFLITLGDTGERKDACDKLGMQPLEKRQAQLRAEYEPDHSAYLVDKDVWEQSRSRILRDKKSDGVAMRADLLALGGVPQEPLKPFLICSEPNWEGLCRLYSSGHPSLGIYTTEGGQFIGGHGMNEEAKLRTITGLSKLWDGAPVDRVRGGEQLFFIGRRLSMHLMIQPRVADAFIRDGVVLEQGLGSRLLTSFPESTVGTRFSHELAATTEWALKRYARRLWILLQRPLPLVEGKRSELVPRSLPLDVEAERLWRDFYDHVEGRLATDGELRPVKGFGNKLPEHAARLAGNLCLLNNFRAKSINADFMERGIVLAEYYATEALRRAEAVHLEAQLLKARELLGWLLDKWPEDQVSLPDIYQRGPYGIRDQATARELVEVLEDHGWLMRVPQGAQAGGVRRREAWRIIGRVG